MKQLSNYLKLVSNMQFIKITVCMLFAIISAGWLGDALKGDCLFTQFQYWDIDTCATTGYILTVLISLAAFIIFTGLAYITGQKLFYRNLKSLQGVRPHRVLIMAVSALATDLKEKNDGYVSIDGKEKFAGKSVNLTGNIAQDIKEFTDADFKVNTQQLLRAIKPHIEPPCILERVFLIGSEGEKGSARILEDVKKILLFYKKDNLEIFTYGSEINGIRFEDVEKLCNVYETLVKEALETKDKNYTEDDIILDVTGGQKTASIAAAMTTFGHNNLKFQYVETDGNNTILTFNIEAGSISKIL